MFSAVQSKTLGFGVVAFGVAAMALASTVVAGGPKHCPSGLAKKESCKPPGQRQHWNRGERIDDGVRYRVFSNHDRYRLQRPSAGEIYIEVGGDIYLIAEVTKRVIEAINLIDAATK
jgi:Ni/Co efflux regulator RcnB